MSLNRLCLEEKLHYKSTETADSDVLKWKHHGAGLFLFLVNIIGGANLTKG